MLEKYKEQVYKNNLTSLHAPAYAVIKIIPVLLSIFCITGCYTVLTPPPEYFSQEEHHFHNNDVDSTNVTNQYINNYYCSSCGIYENTCASLHWRYNYWTSTYYCDPYYYNHSNYNHHCNNNNWWGSNYGWWNNNYSGDYTYSPPKKSRRDRSFTRMTTDYVADNFDPENSYSPPPPNNSNNPQADNTTTGSTANSSTASSNQQDNNTSKPRRKHSRRPL